MAVVLEAFLRRQTASLEEFVNSDACAMLGVREDAQKLLKTMLRLYEIGIIGERNGLKYPQIDLWITDLKDAIYDVDDLIDICVIEGGKILLDDQSVPPSGSAKCSFKIFSCFKCAKYRHEIVFKIREINNRLKELEEASLSAITTDLLASASPSKGTIANFENFGLDFGYLPVGRQIEKAANELVRSMLKGSKKKVELFGIVGMAAIGKTTLAKKVYNDEIIQENYPIRIWVGAKNLSEIDLLKEIIRGAGGDPGKESATKEELVTSLGSSLTKRFLIVLDDVYKPGIWDTLLKVPLGDGVARGRVLIISRDVNVVKDMNATIHQVEKMDVDDGFELLCTEIFGYFDEDEIGLLKEAGVKIVERCEGLPIAIKAVAGMLRTKERTEVEWEKVLERDSWSSLYRLPEEIPAALYVSYEDLPAYLKQCFLYCSLYPEEYPMNRFHLIRHWIAEGLVTVPNGNMISIEDYAEECYEELIGRNMLQISPHNCHYCLIPHSFLRTLARFFITDESVFLEGDQRLIVSLLKPKRLALSNVEKNSLDDPISMKQQRCLRTILLINSPNVRLVDEMLLQTATSLRILDLSNTGIELLPPSIANLTHLRYLNLDRTKITDLSTLIGYLVNLQTLSLRDCQSLHKLPKTINLLYELRCLCLKGTPITHVPKGIINLTKLNHFDGCLLGHGTDKTEGCTLDELHSLSELRYLHMENLERVKETKPGSFPLNNKPSLRDVYLCWQPKVSIPVEEHEDKQEGEQEGEKQAVVHKEEILKQPVRGWSELSPSPSVEKLVFKHYPEQEFPTWLMTSKLGTSLPNLVYLDLFVCPSCTQIPPLGLLPQLKLLRISGADSIKTIGPEFLNTDASSSSPPPSTLPAFEKLESLSIKQMANLEEWSFGSAETTLVVFRNLRSLEIINCPKLKSLPKDLGAAATSLRSLHVESVHGLSEIRNFPHLTDELVIKDNKGLLRLSDLGSLKNLTVDDCQKLKHVNNLTALKKLSLVYPPSTETFYFEELIIFWSIEFPRWLSNLMKQHYVGPKATNNLKRFELTCSLPLLKSCMEGGKNWQVLQQIPEVRGTTCDGKSYLRYSKNRRIYETNIGSED
jgi:NB-ARC domain/Rx N-terminal domain